MIKKDDLQNVRYLSKKRCAKYMNIDITNLNWLIENGYLPVAKIGKRTYRIDRLDADKCIEQLKA